MLFHARWDPHKYLKDKPDGKIGRNKKQFGPHNLYYGSSSVEVL